MQTVPVIIGVIALIFGVGYLVTNSNNESAPVVSETTTDIVTAKESSETENVEVDDQAESTELEATSSTEPGVYTTYDADAIAQSDAEHILLFFHATWCPSCRALDNDIVANADNIPAGVEIYKIDYDTATELKRQYGVTTQHSIIEITASGEAESDISHPLTLEGVLATI